MGNQEYPVIEVVNGYNISRHRSGKWVAERNGIIHASNKKRDQVVNFARSK